MKSVKVPALELFLHEMIPLAKAMGVACETALVEDDHPYQAIIDTAAKRGCDLIAMASHGRRGIAALVLGSETTKVLTHSTIPVLVFR